MASGATPTYGIPYPVSTDPVDVAGDVQDLAVQVDTLLVAKAPLSSPALTGVPTAPTVSNSDNSTKIATTAFVKNQSYLTTATASSTYAPLASPTFTGTATMAALIVTTFTLNRIDTGYEGGEIIFKRAIDNVGAWTIDVYGNTSTPILRFLNSTGSGVVNTLNIDTAGVATFGGTVVTPASTTSVPSLRIPHGTAPSAPTNGDVWTTTVGMYARINGNTIGPFGTGANWQSAAPSPAITGMLWVDSDTDVMYIYNGSAWYSPMGIERNAQTASYTLALTDRSKLVEISNAGATTLFIPTNASVAFPVGTQITILQTGAGQVTIAASNSGTTTVNGTPGLKLRAQWSSATLIKRATDTWVAIGDLAA